MAQSFRSNKSPLSSPLGVEQSPLHISSTFSNGDGCDSDGSNCAPPTPTTLSRAIPAELAGAVPLFDRFQVEGFLRLMQEQSVGPQVRVKITFEDMLCFQKDPIPTSLLKINSDLVSRATKLFQIILKYMGVDSSDRGSLMNIDERIELVGELYKQSLKRSELRDELFAQISKQTRNNPDMQCLIKAWELMYLCASSMPPSNDIGAFLSEYVHNVAHGVNTDSEVQHLALNTLNALKRSIKAGPRQTIPGREEIEALLTGKKLTTIVFFLDETFKEITYDMATTVADAVEELAGIIKFSAYSSFSLYECRKVVGGSKSPEPGNEEHIGLDDNKYIVELLAEFKAAKERSKGEILHCKLIFKKKLFQESDKAVTDPMFIQLSYLQLQHDYILGNYPVGDDAAQLSALQILAEIGFFINPESCTNWTSLLERFLPRQIAITRAKRDWEVDILTCYRSMEHFTKDDARQQFLRILRTLPYGNSVFFSVCKIDDPTGLLPGKIVLGVNKRGVHFFGPVSKEYLLSAKLSDIMKFGSSNTAVFFKMRVAAVLHIFQFETKQGEEICVALQTHISDVMSRRYSKARNTAGSSANADLSNSMNKPPGVEVYEKRMQDLSKALEESLKNADQLLEHMHEKQQHEEKLQEEVQTLKVSLCLEKKNLEEISQNVDMLQALCDEKDQALQVSLSEKRCLETKLAQLANQISENVARKDAKAPNIRVQQKLQEELIACKEELHANKQKVKGLEMLNRSFNQERKTMKLKASELESKFESIKKVLMSAETTISVRDIELVFVQNNLKELNELREMKEDIDQKNEQTAAILKMQGVQLAEMEKLYKEEQTLRKYFKTIEDMKCKNAALKKLVAYWKEQAGKKGDDEELEEIQEERTPKVKRGGRVSMY